MTNPPDGSSTKLRAVWITLILVAAVSIGALISVWAVVDPALNTLGYELARTLMQVVGITVIGGIITVATSYWQERRKEAAAKLEENQRMAAAEVASQRARAAKELEHERHDAELRLARQREWFELRARLLDRSSRCAQTMYVMCQHVARVQADCRSRSNAPETDPLHAAAMTQLDKTYLAFNAEAAAIQTEIGARFGVHRADDTESRHPYLLWHQVYDLLTLYYVNLCRDFPGNAFLNNMPHDTELHSGLRKATVDNQRDPGDDELSKMRKEIRETVVQVNPQLAASLLAAPMKNVEQTSA